MPGDLDDSQEEGPSQPEASAAGSQDAQPVNPAETSASAADTSEHAEATVPSVVPASTPSGRFGSAAPLAPPRPGPSSSPPRRALTPPPPIALPRSVATAPSLDELAITQLRDQLESVQRALATKETEVRVLLAQRDARIAELATLHREVATLHRELASSKAEHARRLDELERQIESAQARQLSDDNLQLIRGIGPAFARELARLGVRTFAQIAAWTDTDIESVAPQIKARADRIRRDDWPARAAQLLRERTGSDPEQR